jgi:hypothetical protein
MQMGNNGLAALSVTPRAAAALLLLRRAAVPVCNIVMLYIQMQMGSAYV